MQFSTKVPIPDSANPIGYDSKIVSLGSCFAESIGEKFQYYHFENAINPFGIIFNPVSLERNIRRILQKESFTEKDIFFHNELWHCFEVHSKASHPDKEYFLEHLNTTLERANRQITEATHIFITLGTAWVYRDIASGEIVANCHKVPQKQFAKELLSTEAIQKSIQHISDLIFEANSKAVIVFTVSPVRHIKDGFTENQHSKSHLFAALHAVLGSAGPRLGYFPSYEIMMDELRDYRFYTEDMLHPNTVAIDYIWKRFTETTVSPAAFPVMETVDAIQKGLAHRPFNPDSESHQKFLQHLNQKINTLVSRFPNMKFE
ncbi:GSCFA domain-containing protein [Flavobacterium humi]|uniref:GSCFA domain-containing protein n=1 Tax=Flavobacterium humi TaxID=2562683 RepID=A0A4Z0L6W1_9FLAO|nr:GSCFA domain-containing protein [Flavobacterium humi]TGD56904.1 GSCFA domain-containing protein [Flavobacterium humi]